MQSQQRRARRRPRLPHRYALEILDSTSQNDRRFLTASPVCVCACVVTIASTDEIRLQNLSGRAAPATLLGSAAAFRPLSVADALRQVGGVTIALMLCDIAQVWAGWLGKG